MQEQTAMEPITFVVRGTGVKGAGAGLSPASRHRLFGLAGPILLLVIWQLLVMTNILNPVFFPAPTQIVSEIVNNLTTGQLQGDVWVSIVRVFWGFLLGAIPGVILGLSMGLFPLVGAILDPLVAALMPIPKLALMPLIMVIFGLGETEKVVVLLLGVVFPVIINTAAGVRNLDRIYLDVAKNYNASTWQYYRSVAWPGALSMIFSGLRLGIGMALLLIVAAEMHGALSGIGYRLWYSYTMFNISGMYVSFVVLALLGFIFTMLLEEVEHLVMPWKRA